MFDKYVEVPLNTQEWLSLRHKSIGGSEAATVLGMNKFQSMLELYEQKIGEAPQKEENGRMFFGKLFEENLIDFLQYWDTDMDKSTLRFYAKEKANVINKPTRMFYHPQYEFMSCNVDGTISPLNIRNEKNHTEYISDISSILEIKQTSRYFMDMFTTEYPPSYMIQTQHNMLVTGVDKAWIAILVDGLELRVFEVVANPEIQKLLIEKETAFWDCVINRRPPEPDGSERLEEYLKEKYKKTYNPSIIDGTFEQLEKIKEYNHISDQIKALETQQRTITNTIRTYIGENAKLDFGSNGYVSNEPDKNGKKTMRIKLKY